MTGKAAVGAVTAMGAKTGGLAAVWGGGMVLAIVLGAIAVLLGVALLFGGSNGGSSSGNLAEAYTSWAERVAADDKVGYSQPRRTSFATRDENGGWGDVDCSSFVYYALLNNGWTEEEIGSWPFTTHSMKRNLADHDFEAIEYKSGMDLKRGDILLDESSHTEIYAGEGKNVGAHSDYDGKTGDGNGEEVSVGNFYEGGWDWVLRCTRGGSSGTIPEPYGTSMTYMAWQKITAVSEQLDFKIATGMPFDSLGFGVVNGRYVVATTEKFGRIGDMYDFTLENGTVIRTIKGDYKNGSDPGCNEWGHNDGATVLEFVVDIAQWPDVVTKNPPDVHPEWRSRVVSYAYVGHYDY